MGIFDVFTKSKKYNKEIKFTTQISKTDNVLETLTDIAKRYNLNLSNLDFDILNIETYIKIQKADEFILMDEETENLLTEEVLLSEDFEIKQLYEIKVKKNQFLDDFELIGKFQRNKSLTIATFVISPQYLISYSNKLVESELLNELYKKKLKSRMLIKFKPFEKELIDDVKKIITIIRDNKAINEGFPVTLCKAIPPILPVKMEVIEHYKNNKREDLSKQLIYPIKKEEIIIEIIKPKQGKKGRDCRGEFIKVSELKNIDIPKFNYDNDDVIKKEDEYNIKYIANKNGYVDIKDNFIFIKEELEVNQISLKTGNVRDAQDSNVKLEVSEKDFMKEAIRDGMLVETTELFVKGNVGNNTKIKAKNLTIEGQTHRNSKIAAIKSEINIHRGLLKGKEVLIHKLEGGRVEAEEVHILQAISGEVIAKEIKIDLLGSHLKLIASDLIEVNELKGSENSFIIDEGIVIYKQQYIKEKEDKIKDLEIKFRKDKSVFDENRQMILRNKSLINELKAKVNEYRKNKMPINSIWIQNIKKFNDLIKATKKIEASLKDIKQKINSIKDELNKMQDSLFSAKIISHSGFNEFNRIEFHIIEPQLKIVYDTNKNDKNTKIFKLQNYEELGGYKIVGSKGEDL
jgi:hypothetical protein